MENPVCEPYQIMMVCEQCNFLSEDLTTCSQCGHSLVQNIAGNGKNGSIPDKESFQTSSCRKREITPFGMYLKEQKQDLKKNKSSQNLDLNSAFNIIILMHILHYLE